jgi:hypothetical protein
MTEPEDPFLPPEEIEGAEEMVEAGEPVEPVDTVEVADTVDADEVLEPAAQTVTGSVPLPPRAASRPDLIEAREPLYRECKGYRLRLDPPDLARLRELAGSRGKTDVELGEAFFDGQADRLAASIEGDVDAPAELRVVVDPYSRQAFVALENRIRGILSF